MRPPVSHEVRDEIAFHIEMTTRELVASGLSPEEARAEAARRFGDVRTVDAECRKLGDDRDRRRRRAELHLELAYDMRFALRQLARAPMFATIAILTLALGIGATTTVFSALYAVVLRPLPFDHPERVVVVSTAIKGEPATPTAAEFAALQRNVRAFDHVAASVLGTGFTLSDGDVPELVGGGRVTAAYFSVLGAKPELGRTFTAAEDAPGGGNVVVLSHRAWIARYAADPGVLGRVLHMNGEAYRVVGVMPRSFDVSRDGEELWVPLALGAAELADATSRYLRVFGRLREGVSLAQGRAEATAVERATVAAFPERRTPVGEFNVTLTPVVDDLVGDYRALLFVLLGAVSLVLLIACTNVANLLLARGAARTKELAIRAALGAGRGRLVRQLLSETLVLATAGAALGLVFTYSLLGVVLRVSPEGVPRLDQAHIDGHVLVFALAVAVASSVLAGLVPAVRVAGPGIGGTLREGGRRSAARAGGALRQTLVASQVALAMTLLTGSGLLLRSAWLLQRVDPGFDPRGVLTARVMLPEVQYETPERIVRAYDAMRTQLAQIPGVVSAATVSVVPLSGSEQHATVFSDRQSLATDAPLTANLRLASPGYFSTLRIPVRAGRDLASSDDAGAPPVIVINEALARKLWPEERIADVIGRRVSTLSAKRAEPRWLTVVGVVGDIHDGALGTPVTPEFYTPVAQVPARLWPLVQRSLVLVARTRDVRRPPESLAKPMAQAVARVDASLALADARSLLSFMDDSLETEQFNAMLLSTLGAIALLLAMSGVYGVVSWFVAQRTHEIGVRVALGATRTAIWTLVIRRGMAAVVAGMLAGLALSFATSSVLQGQLYGVTRGDPITFVTVGLVLVIVSMLATYVPARRALRVSPVEALSAA